MVRKLTLPAISPRYHADRLTSATSGSPTPSSTASCPSTPQLFLRRQARCDQCRGLQDRHNRVELTTMHPLPALGALKVRSLTPLRNSRLCLDRRPPYT